MRIVEPIYEELGKRIRNYRELAGLSQAQVGQKIGRVRAHISQIETGQQRVMVHDIPDLAAILRITPETLLRGIWPKHNQSKGEPPAALQPTTRDKEGV